MRKVKFTLITALTSVILLILVNFYHSLEIGVDKTVSVSEGTYEFEEVTIEPDHWEFVKTIWMTVNVEITINNLNRDSDVNLSLQFKEEQFDMERKSNSSGKHTIEFTMITHWINCRELNNNEVTRFGSSLIDNGAMEIDYIGICDNNQKPIINNEVNINDLDLHYEWNLHGPKEEGTIELINKNTQ